MSDRRIINQSTELLERDASQPRKNFDEQTLKGLAVSIQEKGILQPIRVRPDGEKFTIVFGERRWLAAKLAGLKEVPVVIDNGPSDEAETLSTQLTENIQRAELLPLERAEAINHLLTLTGLNAKETGRKLGLSSASISKLLALLTLSDEIKAQLRQGKIALSTAYEIARKYDTAIQAELAEQAANGQLTREQAGGRAKREVPTSDKLKRPRPPRATAKLPGGRSITVSGEGLSLATFVSWIGELADKAHAAMSEGLELDQFLRSLKQTDSGA